MSSIYMKYRTGLYLTITKLALLLIKKTNMIDYADNHDS